LAQLLGEALGILALALVCNKKRERQIPAGTAVPVGTIERPSEIARFVKKDV
jgi:hypothetical protein